MGWCVLVCRVGLETETGLDLMVNDSSHTSSPPLMIARTSSSQQHTPHARMHMCPKSVHAHIKTNKKKPTKSQQPTSTRTPFSDQWPAPLRRILPIPTSAASAACWRPSPRLCWRLAIMLLKCHRNADQKVLTDGVGMFFEFFSPFNRFSSYVGLMVDISMCVRW